jgi:hypothetical protein
VALADTPATFLVSPDGVVERAWYGAYVGKIKEEVELTFRVKLPGISPPEAGAPHVQ